MLLLSVKVKVWCWDWSDNIRFSVTCCCENSVYSMVLCFKGGEGEKESKRLRVFSV